MSQMEITEIRRVTNQLLLAAGLNPENADVATDVFIRATLRGLGNHDLFQLGSWKDDKRVG